MKLVDGMKDEKLGSAILYNFTKGYQKNVPMNVYNVVLPLLYNDVFRSEVLNYQNINDCINACVAIDENFKKVILEEINNLSVITSKALGISLLNKEIDFQIYEGEMQGSCLPAAILQLNEAVLLGEMLCDKTFEEIKGMLKESDLNIVFLDSATLGKDIDLSKFDAFGRVKVFEYTSSDKIAETIKDAEVVITNKCNLGKEQLETASNLKLICVTATGVNNIDLDYCHEHNITVCNVKGYSTNSVAQHTFSLLLDLYNKNHYYHNYVSSKNYSSSSMFTHLGYSFNELAGKTWGIVGMGDIGQKVASIAEAFDCNIIYYSTSGKNNEQKYHQVDFETLLKSSDVISIHAPLNQNTENLFDLNAFKLMKSSAYLINVGRGKIVNEKDLTLALDKNLIAGAGLDVFEKEPFFLDSPLLQIDNPTKLLMTPHIAWAAKEARNRVVDEVCLNIKSFNDSKLRNVC